MRLPALHRFYDLPRVVHPRHLRQKDLVGHDAPIRLHGLCDLKVVHGQRAPECDLHLIHVELRRALHAGCGKRGWTC
jgi:hypothetical protein